MKGHGKRVAALSVEIARRYGLDEEAVNQIEIAAVLHDIGTIVFPGALIKKYCGGSCSTEELERYRRHPVEGQNLPDENLTQDEILQQAALFHIKQFTFSKFDPTVVKILLDILKEKGVNQAREKKLTFQELEPGMCLTRSVYSSKGHFILPHKTELDSGNLERLKTILDNKELTDTFFVLSK